MEEILATFQDLFGDLFGTKGKAGDRKVSLALTGVEAAFGAKKRVVYTRVVPCPRCVDHGTCDACQGKGQVALRQGELTITRACAGCAGRGRFVEACGECVKGGAEREESLLVEVPPAAAMRQGELDVDGKVLRLQGKGDAPVGLQPGDLYVELHLDGSTAETDALEQGAHPFRGAGPRPLPGDPLPGDGAEAPAATPRRFPVGVLFVTLVALLGAAWVLLR